MDRELNQYEQEHVDKILKELNEYEKIHGEMTQEQKAYFIYRKMGEIYTFKANFFLYSDDQYTAKKEIVQEGTSEDGFGICSDINSGYAIALKAAGINSFLYDWDKDDPFAHVNGGFQIDDNYYYFDLRNDLYLIQTGMRTNSFAVPQKDLHKTFNDECQLSYLNKMNRANNGAKFTGISADQLHEWDDEFEITYHGLYTDDVFDMLQKETMDLEYCQNFFGTSKLDELAQKKFEFIMKYIRIIKNNKTTPIGIVESDSYYKKLLYKLFTQDELKKYIVKLTGFTEENHTRVMKKIVVIKKDNENVFYLYNPETEIYENVNPEDLINAGIMYNTESPSFPISNFIDILNEDQIKSDSDAR